jgi:hypothetical protein
MVIVILVFSWPAVKSWSDRHEAMEMLSHVVPLGPSDSVQEYRIHGSIGPADPPSNQYMLQLNPASYRALHAHLIADGLRPSPNSWPWPWPLPTDGIHFERGGTHFLFCPRTFVVYVSLWYD